MKTQLFVGTVLVQLLAAGQTPIEQSHCAEINELVLVRAVPNRLDEAEASISAAVSKGHYVCAGVALGNVATVLCAHGRIRDAEAFAARSLDLLRKDLGPHDPMLLCPLHVLAMIRLDQGKYRKAEHIFEQMLQARTEHPEQRAQVHVTGGVLRQMQGKLKEAESEYLLAYEEWKQLQKPADADAAALLNYLGDLYTTEGRFQEASQALDRALAIIAVARDVLPLDRVKLLNARAVTHARQGEWPEAQEKLRLAVAIAEETGASESALLKSVLNNYAIVLRKNHHRREARVIESRASALPHDPAAGAVIDVRELSAGWRARQH